MCHYYTKKFCNKSTELSKKSVRTLEKHRFRNSVHAIPRNTVEIPRNSVIFGIPRKLRNVLPIPIKVQKYRSKKNPAEFRGHVRPRVTQFKKSLNPSMLLKKPKTFLPHKALQALSYFLIYSHLILLGSTLEQRLSISFKRPQNEAKGDSWPNSQHCM